MKERIKHLILLVSLIGIDQIVKFWIAGNLKGQEPIIIIPHKILNLQYYENTGAVWGILSGRVDFLRILTLMILVVILFLYFKIPNGKRYGALKILAVFIVAGALGNMIDRFALGYVVDFIYFEFINFPLFNLADCYLTISSVVLVLFALFYYKDEDFAFLEEALGRKKGNVEEKIVVNSSEDEIDQSIMKSDENKKNIEE